jgi:hypothetical protein
MTLLEQVVDLHKQAETDHSHYYTASVLTEVIAVLNLLQDIAERTAQEAS